MVNKRINKEYPIISEKYLKSIIGTTNKHDPKIIYVRTKTKVKPLIEKKDYSDDIKDIRYKLNLYTKELINNNKLFEKKYIINLYIGESSITFDKKSNMKYDIFFKPLIVNDLKSQECIIKPIIENLNRKIFELFNEKNFECY